MSWLTDRLIGATKTHELSASSVDALIDGVSSDGVTNDLFAFGKLLLAATDERAAAIDSKSTALVGYSAAILAFLVTRLPEVRGLPPGQVVTLALAGIAAALACSSAAVVLRGAKNWQGLSETTWFPQADTLASSDKLKRFWLKAMHEMHQSNYRIANRKASQMIAAQLFTALAAVFLAISLVVGVLSK
jgi:hypothetical protein